ncbi:protein SRC2-like [Mangifera indica]|uniref:protein SRC2-like n=1 Tax=Mangifera indica TaxID=29780 RepID=UPI001CFC1EF1|nr:protein SRC2-like [Mangifera indica]
MPMAYRPLELNILYAKNLKNVNLISRMDLYVVVSLVGDHSKKKQKIKSRVDYNCGPNPTWNFPVKFTVDELLGQQNRLSLQFKIKCTGFLRVKKVGKVNVPVKDLLDIPGDVKIFTSQTYQVMKPSGKPKGELTFSFKFGDIISAPAAGAATVSMNVNAGEPYGSYDKGKVNTDEPVMAYPAVMGSSSAPYGVHGPYPPPPGKATTAAPPQGYGYPYAPPPPPQGYGYGYPGQGGYGYPPVQQPPKKSKFGGGMGAGLIGGMLGGMILGDIVSDAADDCYYDDYDGGFDY